MEDSKRFNRKYILNLLIPVLVSLVLWFFPWRPVDVPIAGWQMFSIFIGTIAAIILKALPMGAIAIIGLTISLLTGTLETKTALDGFASTSVWLVVFAFFISKGIVKTGLGHRIAYIFVEKFGQKTTGLAYSLFGVSLIIGPATPSGTARAGGIMYPIAQALSESYGSRPDDGTRKKIGSFLMQSIYHGDSIVGTMFLTAGATKPLAQEIAARFGVEITWMNWFMGGLLPGLISLAIIPLVLYKIDPPEIKETPKAAEWARGKREELGKMSFDEKVTTVIFVLAIILWMLGQFVGLSAQAVALLAVSLLLLTKVLKWSDITEDTGAWNTLMWFAILVMMAGQLNELGFISWFSESIAQAVNGWGWLSVFVVLCLVYFYSHYFFASLVAHVTAMYPAFLGVALAAGAPPLYAALMLAYVTNIAASTTHYASGPASILFGAGYVTQNEWWKNCFILGVIYLVLWLGLGSAWMFLIGLV